MIGKSFLEEWIEASKKRSTSEFVTALEEAKNCGKFILEWEKYSSDNILDFVNRMGELREKCTFIEYCIKYSKMRVL